MSDYKEKEVEREELIKLLLSQLDRKPRNNEGKVTKDCTCIIFDILICVLHAHRGQAAKVQSILVTTTTSFVCIIIIVCCGQPQKEKTDDFFGVIEQALIHLSALHMNDPRQPPNLFFILWGCGKGGCCWLLEL